MNSDLKFVALILLSLTAASGVVAQSLEINRVTLSLGESEAKARADIQAAGMTISRESGKADLFSLHANDNDFGSVEFGGGKVVLVWRNWYLNETMRGDLNILSNLFYSAMSSLLEGRAGAPCIVIVRNDVLSPGRGAAKDTSIFCDGKGYKHSVTLSAVDCSSGCKERFTSMLYETISDDAWTEK